MDDFLANRCRLKDMPTWLHLARSQTPPWHACTTCNVFVQRKRRRTDKGRRILLPMVKLLRYIVSGGATCKPDRRSMLACLAALVEQMPSNPLLQLFGPKLQDAARRLAEAPWAQHETLVATMFCEHNGFPVFFADHRLARNIRRRVNTSAMLLRHTGQQCRYCCGEAASASSYAYALLRGSSSVDAALQELERQRGLLAYITCYCTNCARVSVISYAHDSAQPYASGMPSSEAYYLHQLSLAENVYQLLQ